MKNPRMASRCPRGITPLILGAMYAEMAPPRACFDRLWKGLRPVGRITNPLRNTPGAAALLCILLLLSLAAWAGEADRNISVDVDADPPVIPAEVRSSIARAQKYLKSIQEEDGRMGGGTGPTALATLALMVDGSVPGYGPYGKETAKGVKFILAQAKPSGLIARPGHDKGGVMYHHGLSTLCLAEIWGMTGNPEVRPVLKRAVELIIRCQNSEGGWRYNPAPVEADLSATVMQIVALRASQNAGIAVPTKTMENAVAYVKRLHHKKSGGGFGYRGRDTSAPPRSAAGVISLQLCGEYESTQAKEGLEYLWKLSSDFKKVGRFEFYFHYYAMQSMYQSRDSKKWREWYPKACKRMMSTQDKHGRIGQAVYQTAMATLAMGLPYRYLPVYQR
ncbi:prenyltransferase [Planctomycetota bacterium]